MRWQPPRVAKVCEGWGSRPLGEGAGRGREVEAASPATASPSQGRQDRCDFYIEFCCSFLVFFVEERRWVRPQGDEAGLVRVLASLF